MVHSITTRILSRSRLLRAIPALALLLLAGPARGQILEGEKVAYELTISSDRRVVAPNPSAGAVLKATRKTSHEIRVANNNPAFRLENESETASITRFQIMLRDPAAVFSMAMALDSRGGPLFDPVFDITDGGATIDVVLDDPLAPGESLTFVTDLDAAPIPLGLAFHSNYTETLFQLDGVSLINNALVTVIFDRSEPLVSALPDFNSLPGTTLIPDTANSFTTLHYGGAGCCGIDVFISNVESPPVVIPEPASVLLLALGAFPFAAMIRRRLRTAG